MNALQIDALLRKGTINISLNTLAQQKPLTFRYANGNLTVTPESTGTESTPISADNFRKIYERYIAAGDPERTQSSYYNAPKWPAAPDLNSSPWAMRLIHYFETGE